LSMWDARTRELAKKATFHRGKGRHSRRSEQSVTRIHNLDVDGTNVGGDGPKAPPPPWTTSARKINAA
jgi:hypothetical protein